MIGHEVSDFDCDLDYVPNVPTCAVRLMPSCCGAAGRSRKPTIGIHLKNSFGFGGKNSALVIRKFEL